ncbi:MAG: Ig-like domain-containing protein [Myxococcaceae bacterium]
MSPNVSPTLSFSEPMNTALTIAAMSAAAGTCSSYIFDTTGTLLTCVRTMQFAASTPYSITVGTGAKDAAGNALAAPFTLSFTTGTAVDNVAPTLTSTTPTNMGTGASRSGGITAVFSEAMDKAATQSAFAISSPSGVTGTFTWNAAGTQMTFTPSSAFTYGATIQWQISATAKDLANNALGVTQQRSFRIARQGSTTLYPSFDGYMRLLSGAYTTYTSYSYATVGDSSSGSSYRSFFTFDLSGLPAGTFNITEASLNLNQYTVSGTPYDTTHGNIIVERTSYADKIPPLPSSAWDTAALKHGGKCQFVLCAEFTAVTVSTTATAADWKIPTVTTFTDAALADKKVQFRVRFSKADSDGDATSDFVYFGTADWTGAPDRRAHLEVTYEYP